MQPNQPQQPPNPNTGPNPGPTPGPGYQPQPGQPNYGPPQPSPLPAQPVAPQPVAQPQPQPYQNPYQQPAPQPAQTPAPSWHTPPPAKGPAGPASASDYVQQAQAGRQPDPNELSMSVGSESQSIDYLNKLAGVKAGSSLAAPSQKIILIGVGAFLALSLAVLLLVFSGKEGPAGPSTSQTLYTAIFNESQITKSANKNIRDSKLSALNSAFNGQLLNDLTAMTEPLAKRGIDAKELQKAAKKVRAYDEILDELTDARLNATYDTAYARHVEYELKNIVMLMERIEKYSSNKTMVEYVKKDVGNYKSLQDGLEAYDESLIRSGG